MNTTHRAALGLGLLASLSACQSDCGGSSKLRDNIERTVGDSPEAPGLMGGSSSPLKDDAAVERKMEGDAGPFAAPPR